MIVGVDLSTTRLDYALINPTGGVEATHTRLIVIPKGASEAERAREAAYVTRSVLWKIPDLYAVVIERPIGRYAVPQLSAIFGAVAAAVPKHAAVTEMKATEWRVALGLPARASKEATIFHIGATAKSWLSEIDEHEADAIGIGLAYHQQCLSVTTDR